MKHHEKCRNTLTIHENTKHEGKNNNNNNNNTGKTIKTKRKTNKMQKHNTNT